MFHLRLCLFLCVNLFLLAYCSFPVEILCANSTCEEPISKAVGSLTYASSSRNVLSFKPGQDITIISKSKNKNEYWRGIINGRIGFVPSHLIKEVRIFHRFEDLIPVSLEALTQNVSTEPKKTETDLPQNPNQVQNEKVTPQPPVAPIVPTQSGSPSPQNNGESASESYKVVEGTTLFAGSPDQITPSKTIDATPQTTVSGAEPQKQGALDERATIPPEVLSLNDNYQGQMLLMKNNLTIENEDEEEESEDDEGFDEEDEEEDDEVEEEENIINTEDEEIKKETAQENLKPKVVDPVPTLQLYTATVKENENNVENKAETVIVVESSVSSQVSAKIGDEIEKKADVPTVVSEVSTKAETVTKSDTLTTADSIPVKNNLKIDEVYPGINIPSQNQAQINNDFTTPEPLPSVTSNSYTVSAQTVPDNIISTSGNILQNPAYNGIPSNVENIVAISNMPDNSEKQDRLQDPAATVSPNIVSNMKEPNTPYVPANMVPPNIPEQVTTKTEPESIVSNSIFEPSISSTLPKSSVENTFIESIDSSTNLDNSVPSIMTSDNINEDQKILNENTQEKLESVSPTPPSIMSAFEAVESVAHETVTEVNIETMSSFGEKSETDETTTQVPDLPEKLTEVPETQTNTNSGLFEKVLDENEKISSPEIQESEAGEEVAVSEGVTESSIGAEGTCENSDYCNDFLTEEQQQQTSFLLSWFPSTFNGVPLSSNTFMYLVITAVTVLLFTLGHNFIEKMRKTGPLIAKINKLEQELLVSTKECFLLKEEMQNAKEKIVLYENSANDELVVTLQTELEESKKTKSELESQIEVLQQELDAATEAGLDLNKMLSEVLTQKGGSETLLASVENLQAQLNSQQKVIDEMTKKLGVKNEENEVLQTALDAANEKAESLEEKLNDMKQNLNIHLKEKEDLVQDLKSQINQLQTRINQINETKEKEFSKVKKNSEELEKKLAETSKALNIKEEEFKTLKDSIKQVKGKGNVNLETVFDVSRCKAELANAEKEKQSLQAQLKKEEEGKNSLEEQLKTLTADVQSLKKSQEEAEQKKEEAEKKLEVLSNYFKEKETQLQKELGLQEALWAQKKGDEKAVYNMMKSLQEEVESYKSQNETLKKEILDQERGLKNQIASLKQKAHENWVAARQAERKLEESKQETAQLRNRLTLVEKNTNNVDGKVIHRTSEELNGEPNSPVVMHDTSSPLLFPPPLTLDPSLPPGFMPPHPMFMPPPMSGFMPPPPPPFLPGDRRPPPLGRMSSPPLNNRFSPSSPADFPFERMSSPPLSPPARNYRSPNEADRDSYRHRSPPYPPLHPRNWDDGSEIPGFIPISSQRESIREHKGSNVSSGHSSSDSLDKSSRHSGRV